MGSVEFLKYLMLQIQGLVIAECHRSRSNVIFGILEIFE
jgi:hypothetical protein